MGTASGRDQVSLPVSVVIQQDDIHRKVLEVSRGEETWAIVLDHAFIDNYHRLWRWYFQASIVSTFLFVPSWEPPEPTWPTWEQALEDALDTLVPVVPATSTRTGQSVATGLQTAPVSDQGQNDS